MPARRPSTKKRRRRQPTITGRLFKSWRLHENLSQQECADFLGVSRTTCVNWEAGVSSPRERRMPGLCRLFGVSVGEFYTGPPLKKRRIRIVDDPIRKPKPKRAAAR